MLKKDNSLKSIIEKKRNTAVFYVYGLCNLNCSYCSIDKNPVLKDIDIELKKSFEDENYYFNLLTKYFKPGNLRRVETWGGEPFQGMHRIYPLLNKIINYYPNFYQMYSSTNFSYPEWEDEFFGLMAQFGNYPLRKFNYILQLSIDGPREINDAGRGFGVTAACLKNFKKLIFSLKENRLPKNITLQIDIKSTLNIESLYKLNNKEKIIEYFQFFENEFYEPIRNLKKENIYANVNIPNFAVPAPATVEDGKVFANICRLTRQIEQENKIKAYFKFYREITLYSSNLISNNDPSLVIDSYKQQCDKCGTGSYMMGFMPDDMISVCHEGFTELVDSYKKATKNSKRLKKGTILFNKYFDEETNRLCMSQDTYKQWENTLSKYWKEPNPTARLATITAEIILLAMCNQIDRKYLNNEEALKAAIFFVHNVADCIKANYNATGSITLYSYGELKLFLNGALDYIMLGVM